MLNGLKYFNSHYTKHLNTKQTNNYLRISSNITNRVEFISLIDIKSKLHLYSSYQEKNIDYIAYAIFLASQKTCKDYSLTVLYKNTYVS